MGNHEFFYISVLLQTFSECVCITIIHIERFEIDVRCWSFCIDYSNCLHHNFWFLSFIKKVNQRIWIQEFMFVKISFLFDSLNVSAVKFIIVQSFFSILILKICCVALMFCSFEITSFWRSFRKFELCVVFLMTSIIFPKIRFLLWKFRKSLLFSIKRFLSKQVSSQNSFF